MARRKTPRAAPRFDLVYRFRSHLMLETLRLVWRSRQWKGIVMRNEETPSGVEDASSVPTMPGEAAVLRDGRTDEAAEGSGVLVAVLSAEDEDPGEALRYELVGGAVDLFEIVDDKIFLRSGADIGSSFVHDVILRVTDATGESYDETISLDLADIIEMPSETVSAAGFDDAIPEDALGALATAEFDLAPDVLGEAPIDLAGGDDAADDEFGMFASEALPEVVDEDDMAPAEAALADAVGEAGLEPNTDDGQVVAFLGDADVDDGETYAIADDPSGKFEIVGKELRVKQGAALDTASGTEFDIEIAVTEASGETYSETITIDLAEFGLADAEGDPGIGEVPHADDEPVIATAEAEAVADDVLDIDAPTEIVPEVEQVAEVSVDTGLGDEAEPVAVPMHDIERGAPLAPDADANANVDIKAEDAPPVESDANVEAVPPADTVIDDEPLVETEAETAPHDAVEMAAIEELEPEDHLDAEMAAENDAAAEVGDVIDAGPVVEADDVFAEAEPVIDDEWLDETPAEEFQAFAAPAAETAVEEPASAAVEPRENFDLAALFVDLGNFAIMRKDDGSFFIAELSDELVHAESYQADSAEDVDHVVAGDDRPTDEDARNESLDQPGPTEAPITAPDRGIVSGPVTYSLADDAGGLFAIDPETGIVTVAGAWTPQMADSYDIAIIAAAPDGTTTTEAVTINLSGIDEDNAGAEEPAEQGAL